MSHNIDSMAYHGEPPWHGLGTEVKHRPTSKEMIAAAGLDWEVEMRPIALRGQPANQKARRYQLIRMPPSRFESEIPLGMVGRRYRPLQNAEAFDFFDPIVGKNTAFFETAGALGNGERIWVLAKVPGEMHILGDDCCARYLLLSNSHDGRSATAIKFTPIRVVCQNTLILALSNGAKAYTVRHTKNMDERLSQVQQILATTWKTFAAAVELFRGLAAVSLNSSTLDQYLDRVYPRSPEERDCRFRPAKWEAIIDLFERGDRPALKPSHTLWGAYNAVARYEDYREAKEDGPDRRLHRVWFGPGAALKLKALREADFLRRRWAT